jgi:signal transduction histidine kinase
LRSPMTVVAGIADILEKRFDDLAESGRIELLETLGREARRLTRLVSDVLDLESTDRGVSQLRLEEIDLVQLARESVADAGQASRTKLVAEAGHAIARGDRDRLKQVILNLLSNAAKFSAPGAPITITVSPQEKDVRVSVRDEGVGIAGDQQHLLFQRFSRLASAGAPRPGSGIGLYLCKTIVDRHGGSIWLESGEGQGATFLFTVPR